MLLPCLFYADKLALFVKISQNLRFKIYTLRRNSLLHYFYIYI